VKNYFAIAFTCVYLIMTVGVAKTTHYCMDRKYNSSLFTFDGKPCACFLSAKGTGKVCCTDEHEVIKIEDDQNQGKIVSTHIPEFFEIGFLYTELIVNPSILSNNIILSYSEDDPPPLRLIFKINCSFVFYDDQLLA
jgi:hypothetical protein